VIPWCLVVQGLVLLGAAFGIGGAALGAYWSCFWCLVALLLVLGGGAVTGAWSLRAWCCLAAMPAWWCLALAPSLVPLGGRCWCLVLLWWLFLALVALWWLLGGCLGCCFGCCLGGWVAADFMLALNYLFGVDFEKKIVLNER